MIRVVLVDDQNLIRQGVRSLLELAGDIAVVARPPMATRASRVIRRERPDVVLLDLRMPKKDGVEVLRRSSRGLLPPTIILTTFDDDAALLEAVKAGRKVTC
jgi:DNA-binding NarL/FixJ family response regulator